jgi:hypothetical protein
MGSRVPHARLHVKGFCAEGGSFRVSVFAIVKAATREREVHKLGLVATNHVPAGLQAAGRAHEDHQLGPVNPKFRHTFQALCWELSCPGLRSI